MVSSAPVSGGAAEIALALTTRSGRVFVKGARGERAMIEGRVQPYLPVIAPRMLWQETIESWFILAFEHVDGRHVSLAPSSSDLGRVADAAHRISLVRCPDLPVLPVENRWARFATPESLALLRGDFLVHTDLTPENFLVASDQTWVVDWGWPSVGAPWLDTVTLVVRLIQSGHDPAEAEEWAQHIPAWRDAPRAGVRAYAEIRAAVAERNAAPIRDAWLAYRTWLSTVR
ncbi:hypothetical protein [Alloactinosynnema sp. L-07]|nr:hypothetical protein [Alloactinosynnema sp. L-07]